MEKNIIKAIIWDMGGVILRTEDYTPREALAKSLGTSRKKLEWEVFNSPTAIQATNGELPVSEHFKQISMLYNLDDSGMEAFRVGFWGGDRVDETLLAAIRGYRKNYITAMLSNAWDTTRQVLTNDFPCLEPFDIAIFSAEVKLAKPQPEIYQLMLEKLAVEPGSAVFIDDFKENVNAANALGIHGIHFQNRDQSLADLEEFLGNQKFAPAK
jgi:epoxide hydrolase-like predicted phosphatase